MKRNSRYVWLTLFTTLIVLFCLLGVSCKGNKDVFEFKKQPPEKVVIYSQVVMTDYFKKEENASYKLKVSYYNIALESDEVIEQDSMVFPCENYGNHTFTVVRTKDKKTAELSCVINVVPEKPAMTAAKSLEVLVGETKSFSDLYRESSVITTPFETEETAAFTSVKIKEQVVDLKNATTEEETESIEGGCVFANGQFTFSKQAIYEFTISASNSEGTVEQLLTVVCVNKDKIPEGITASKAFFGENNDTVMLLKSTNIEDVAFFSYDEMFNYDESNVRVEFLGDEVPQIIISSETQDGNLKLGTGYLSTFEQNREQYQIHGPNRVNSRLAYSSILSLSKLEKEKHYVLDLFHHTFRNTTNTAVGYRVVTVALHEKNEDGDLTLLGTYNARWNFDTNTVHETLKEGYILFLGSTRKDITFKYYKPSAPVLGTPTLSNVGSTVNWTETVATVGQDSSNMATYIATGYQIQFNGGEWEDYSEMSYTVADGIKAGKYELNVRAVYTVDGQNYYGATSTVLIYHNVLNINPLRLNITGNTVSWGERQGYCNTYYQYMINNSGEWVNTAETSLTLKGYERGYQSVTVRCVYFDDKGDQNFANDETIYTAESTVAVSYNLHKATESSGSVSFSSKLRTDMSYVAYEGGTLASLINQHLKISFVGRNMPTVRFLANVVQPDTYKGSGAYVTHDSASGYRLLGSKQLFVYDAGVVTTTLNEAAAHVMYTGVVEDNGLYYVYVYVFQVKGNNYISLLGKSISEGYTAEQLKVSTMDDLYTIVYGNAHYANLTFDISLMNQPFAEVANFDKKPIYVFDEVNKTITWDALEGVDSYKVIIQQNDEVIKEETVTQTTYSLRSLADGYYTITVFSVFEKFYSTASTTKEILLGAKPEAIPLSWMGNAITWKDRSLVDHYEVYVNGTKVADLADGTERYTLNGYKAGETLSLSVVAIYVAGNAVEQSENVACDFIYGSATMNKISPVAGKITENVDYIEFNGFSGATWMMVEFTGKNAPNFAFNAKNAYSLWNNESYTSAGIFITLSNEKNWGEMKITNSFNTGSGAGVWKTITGSKTNPIGLGYYEDDTKYVMILGFDKDKGTSKKDNIYYYLYSVSDSGTLVRIMGGVVVEDIALPNAGGSKAIIYPNIKNGAGTITFNFANPANDLNSLVLGLEEQAFPYKSQLKAEFELSEVSSVSRVGLRCNIKDEIIPTGNSMETDIAVGCCLLGNTKCGALEGKEYLGGDFLQLEGGVMWPVLDKNTPYYAIAKFYILDDSSCNLNNKTLCSDV